MKIQNPFINERTSESWVFKSILEVCFFKIVRGFLGKKWFYICWRSSIKMSEMVYDSIIIKKYDSSQKIKLFESRGKNHMRTHLCDSSRISYDSNYMILVMRNGDSNLSPKANHKTFSSLWFESRSLVIWIWVMWFVS